MRLEELREKIRVRLRDRYGRRLIEAYLYGSAARGDLRAESDIDVMVVLEGPVSVYKEICGLVDETSDLEMEMGDDYRPIHMTPVSGEQFAGSDFPLYREVKNEGIPL